MGEATRNYGGCVGSYNEFVTKTNGHMTNYCGRTAMLSLHSAKLSRV